MKWKAAFTLFTVFLVGLFAGTVDTVFTPSLIMDRDIPAVVVFPSTDENRNLPVVYLLHGYGGDAFNWQDHIDLAPLADKYEMIIVCPDGSNASWYLDSPVDPASQYATYVGRELVRWIDDNYPTIPAAEFRGITGLSMGGHGALYLASAYPDNFTVTASMSGGVDLTFSTKKYEIAQRIGSFEEYPRRWQSYSVINRIGQLARFSGHLLVDCGVDDIFIDNNRTLHQRLTTAGIEHQYWEKPGRHSWDYWTATLPGHLEFFQRHFSSQSPPAEPPHLAQVGEFMQAALADSAWPGAVLLAMADDQIVHFEAVGHHTYDRRKPTHLDDIFDLASVTKVAATTAAAMALYNQGRLDIEHRITKYLPEFSGPHWWRDRHKRKVKIKHLLTHTAGLPPYRRFYQMDSSATVLDSLYDTHLEQPPGKATVYSDIGMILMGKIIERISGQSLADFTRQEVFSPLNMTDTGFLPPRQEMHRIVPTEIDPNGQLIHGYVHDENSHRFGGITGHAGLFSTAADLSRLASLMLNRGELDGVRLFDSTTVALFTRPVNLVPESSRCLGWDSPSGRASGGVYISDDSFGHTGYTGTSFWIDRENQIAVILLTNAVHPNRSWKSPKYYDWRQRIHSGVYQALGFESVNPALELRSRWQTAETTNNEGTN